MQRSVFYIKLSQLQEKRFTFCQFLDSIEISKELIVFLHYFIFFTVIALIVYLEIRFFLRFVDKIVCVDIKNQIPFISSGWRMRRALIKEIKKHYPKYKTAVDIGAGDCGLARLVARRCNMHVSAIENMWLSLMLARMKNFIWRARNVELISADAFEYLRNTDKKYDIGIAYLGPGVNERLVDVAGRFRVIITLAIPISGVKPTRVLERVGGGTMYGKKWYVNNIYVYETPLKRN